MNSFQAIAARALVDEPFREGLRVAADVCRSTRATVEGVPSCPAGVAAVYIDRLADGELP